MAQFKQFCEDMNSITGYGLPTPPVSTVNNPAINQGNRLDQNKLRLAQQLQTMVKGIQTKVQGANIDPSQIKNDVDNMDKINRELKKMDTTQKTTDAANTAAKVMRDPKTLNNQQPKANIPTALPPTRNF